MLCRELPKELEEHRVRIRDYALGANLDFFEVIYEMVDFSEMNMVASYSGFPTRYPHWRFGMQFEELQKNYSYGLGKIYELVINTDPCYAYLMRNNAVVAQKMVMSHVYGHSDFFKNNAWFAQTNRKMLDAMANHATRVRRYIDAYGIEEVESFIDCILSLENLIDVHAPYFTSQKKHTEEELEKDRFDAQGGKFPAKAHMETFINPPDVLAKEKEARLEEIDQKENFPEKEERDVLGFMLMHAPLKRWQRDVLSIIRDEAYYFAPQRMTKIMNEGWASFWHSRIMTTMAMEDSEVIEYAEIHSGTMGASPGALNPYKVGIELFRDIEDRWNKGQFGLEYESCTDYLQKKNWNQNLNQGLEKVFQVRKIYNDITFIDEFLTEEFCDQHKLFTYRFDRQSGQYVIDNRDFGAIKSKLLDSLSNSGQPSIAIVDGNYKNRGELLLQHGFSGTPLRADYARATLENLYKVWNRPVHIETSMEGRTRLLSYNGSRHEEKANA